MNRLQRAAVLLTLLEQLQARGSWCGETHVQKSVYFLQDLLQVPLGFEFVLYKHGPYSFDLNDEITAVQLHGRRMAAAVLLIQALGGGWTADELPSPKAASAP